MTRGAERKLRIVVFFASRPGKTHVVPGDPDGPRQIDLLARSARIAVPDARLVVLTSHETDLSAISLPFERVDDEVDFDRLMLERTRMQRSFLEAHSGDGPVAFLDSDILLAGDLGRAFEAGFDVALTRRPHAEMPFNGGVILVSGRQPEAGIAFFRKLEALYRARHAAGANWYGDQYALNEIVGLDAPTLAATETHEVDGIRLRFLPGSVYNHSPPNRSRSLFRPKPDALVFHFKGYRRRFMEPFWALHFSPEGRSDPLRWPKVTWTALRFAVTRRAYRHALQGDRRRFDVASASKNPPSPR